MRLATALRFDIKFQFRHGFYYAYLFVTLVYVGLLRIVPSLYRGDLATVLVSTDPGVLGFFFIGGIVLLERDQNTFASLFVTPLRVDEYLLSKVASLTILAVLTSLAIAVLSFGPALRVLPLVLGVVLTSVLFTLLGISLAVRSRNLNQFLILSSVTGILFLPLLDYFQVFSSPVFSLFPVKLSLTLIGSAFKGGENAGMLLEYGVFLLWAVGTYSLARKDLTQYIMGTGGRK